MLRGNVDTRLAKLEAGECDAILLALAGLKRLGLDHGVARHPMTRSAPRRPGPGRAGLQTREDEADARLARAMAIRPACSPSPPSAARCAALEGSCRTAMGAHARLEGDASPDRRGPDAGRRAAVAHQMAGVGPVRPAAGVPDRSGAGIDQSGCAR